MQIQKTSYQSYSPAFRAKFINSEALKQVVEYAVEHKKFDKLNQARKNIDNSCLTVRLLVDIGETENGKPYISFTKFEPKKNIIIPSSNDDYREVKTVKFVSEKKMNPLKFAYEKIIKLGNDAPNNNMYKHVVLLKK